MRVFKAALLAVAIVLLGSMAMITPRLLGEGSPLQDPQGMLGGYDLDYLAQFFAALGEDGRSTWRTMLVYIDTVFIAAATLWMGLNLARATRVLALLGAVCLIGFVALDLTENLTLLGLLEGEATLQGPHWVSTVTSVKLVAFVAAFLLALWASFQGRRSNGL